MITESAFHILLDRLDADSTAAAEKYEVLRLKIIHILKWRGCAESHADELADVTLDRVAAKLAAGEVVENLNAFAAAVARFVSLEHSRKNKLDAVGDDLPDVPVDPDLEFDDPDERMKCLRRCFAKTVDDDDRSLVLGYYDTDAGEKAKEARRRLADSFGMTMNALKVRACRLRMRLEACINDCVAGVTISSGANTKQQEVT